MTTIYDATRPVKTNKPFGKGLLRNLPSYRSDHTADDEAWLIADNARREAELDRLVDERFEEVEAQRLIELGLSY